MQGAVFTFCIEYSFLLFQSPETASFVTRRGTIRCFQSGKMETRDTKTPGKVDDMLDATYYDIVINNFYTLLIT